jgi:hypothetical protein
LALAAVICGVLGLCLFPFAIAAIVTGVMGRNQINASGGMKTGGGMATAGIVLGAIGVILTCVGVIFQVVIMGGAMAGA